MKTTAFLLICCSLFLFSCKKGDDKNGSAAGGSISKFLDGKDVVDTLRRGSAGNFEAGFRFKTSRDGKITHLGCMSSYTGSVRVSLWDATGKNVIVSIPVSAQEGKFAYTRIPDIKLEANREYVLSMNNFADGAKRDYYFADKKGSITSIYPFSVDGITVLATHLRETRELLYPLEPASDQEYLVGIPDFIFE